MPRNRPHRWLALLPALALLGGVPFANRVHALVHGWPFLLVWILACVIATSGVMAVVAALDRRADAAEGRAAARGGEPGGPPDPAGFGRRP